MPGELSDNIKVYEVFRDRIKHQDTLINHRVSFFLTFESAIFAAWKVPNVRQYVPGGG